MKKLISFVLSIVIMAGLCTPAFAVQFKKASFRIVVPEDWEMSSGDSRSVESVFCPSITNRIISWTSDNEDVASVDMWGRVTALKEGTATITAKTENGLSSSAVLRVDDTPTKTEKPAKEKHDYSGTAEEEGSALQKIVTRYAKSNSADVPENVKDESLYPNAQKAVTSDSAVWEITGYGVLRTDKNAENERDVQQRFMGDRYFYSTDSENVRAIFSDGTTGIWTVMDGGYTHIELQDISGADKAVMMSDATRKYIARHGLTDCAYYNGSTKKWVPSESDNDGLWTSMFGAGELMRYAVMRDDPEASPEEIAEAKKSATLSAEAVLMVSNVAMRRGTTQGYVRAQRNGNVDDLNIGKFYTSEALVKGGDYSQNIPCDSPATAFRKMYNKYMLIGTRSYIMDSSNLSLFKPEDWVNPMDSPELEYASRTRSLDGFWARTYSVKQENPSTYGNIYWSVNDDGTATGVSSLPETDDEYLLNGENYRGKVVDASGEVPARLWNDILGAGYKASDIIYKGDTSMDEIIGHLFIYKLAYDILGDEDPELKEIIVNTVTKFAKHLVDNNYCLTEATGQPTTWGKFSRTYLHNGQNLGGGHLQATVLLSAFKLAAYMTGDKKWEDEYRMAAFDPAYEYAEVMTQAWDRYKMVILEHASSVSPVLSFFLRPFMETKTIKTVYRMALNYSDEEMAMLAFYLLFQMEDDEEMLCYFRNAFDQWWYSVSYSENPLWYYIYQLAYPDKEITDYYGNNILETSAWSLSRNPIDMITYCATNDNRDDVREINLKKDCDISGTKPITYDPSYGKPLFSDSENNTVKVVGIVLSLSWLKWTVAPPDERSIHKFNSPTYSLNSDYSPNCMEPSTTYTLPYWMGRYHGMLK